MAGKQGYLLYIPDNMVKSGILSYIQIIQGNFEIYEHLNTISFLYMLIVKTVRKGTIEFLFISLS